MRSKGDRGLDRRPIISVSQHPKIVVLGQCPNRSPAKMGLGTPGRIAGDRIDQHFHARNHCRKQPGEYIKTGRGIASFRLFGFYATGTPSNLSAVRVEVLRSVARYGAIRRSEGKSLRKSWVFRVSSP